MQNDRFKQRFWISATVVIFTVVVSSAILYFLSAHVGQTANAVGAERKAAASGNATLQDLANLEQDAPAAANYQAAMDKLLTSQAALIAFPTQIEAMGRTHSVSTSFSFEGSPAPATAAGPGSTGFSLDVSGPIANVIAFLEDFESASPILLSSLETMSISGDGSNYTLSAQGTVYFK